MTLAEETPISDTSKACSVGSHFYCPGRECDCDCHNDPEATAGQGYTCESCMPGNMLP